MAENRQVPIQEQQDLLSALGLGGDQTTATPPFSPSPTQPSFEEQIQALLAPSQPEPLSTKERLVGGFSDAIQALVNLRTGRQGGGGILQGIQDKKRAGAQEQQRLNVAKAGFLKGEQDREEDRVERDRREARENAEISRKVAEGKVATAEDMERLRVAFDLPEKFDPSNPLSAGRIRGLAMKKQMEQERADSFTTRRNRTAEEEAKEDAKMETSFLDEVDQMEFSLVDGTLLEGVANPESVRESFYDRVRRRMGPDSADRMIREFERKVGPAINKAIMEQRKKQQGQDNSSIGGASAALLGGGATPQPAVPMGLLGDLMKAMALGGDKATKPEGASILGPVPRKG